MKKSIKLRYMAFGVMLTLLISNLVVPAAAAFVQKTISVSTGVSIYLDDNKLSPTDVNGKAVDVFVYNGTTYLPVRAVSEALGKPVQWEGTTQSVYIGKHSSTTPAVMLTDLKSYVVSEYQQYWRDNNQIYNNQTSVEDNMGNVYHDFIYCTTSYSIWQQYAIDGQYSKISGTVFTQQFSKDYSGYLMIYGDGKLLYTSENMTGGVRPSVFNVDITGVLDLKIELKGYTLSIGNCGLYT